MKGRVVLFIVEGPSDQDALIPWIEQKLKKQKIRTTVKVVYGDLLTQYKDGTKDFSTLASNVKGEIKKLVSSFLNSPIVKADQIKANDISEIYYVTDTDDCFQKTGKDSVNKKECLTKMFNFESIEILKGNVIRFEVIFMAKNLEDVLCSKKDATDEEKEKISIEFGIRSLKEETLFMDTFSDKNLMVWKDYKESYAGIKSYSGRASNMNILIKEIL